MPDLRKIKLSLDRGPGILRNMKYSLWPWSEDVQLCFLIGHSMYDSQKGVSQLDLNGLTKGLGVGVVPPVIANVNAHLRFLKHRLLLECRVND